MIVIEALGILINTNTYLIFNAWCEVSAARAAGDRDAEALWVAVMDRLLDSYSGDGK